MDFCCAICRNIVLKTAATNLVTCTDLNTESCFTMLFICVVLQKSFKHQVRVACKWDWAILYQCPLTYYWSVREITKVSNTFSATNINSNIEWLFQLHDTIQMKSNYTWINYNHDSIATRSHIMIYNCAWNLIFGTNFSCISLTKGEKRLFLLTCIVRQMVLICLMQNMDVWLLYKSNQITRLVSHLINQFSKWMFTVWQENSTKFGSKNEILHFFLYH